MQSRVAVIILAAGGSSRFGGPKQLAVVGGRTLLGRTLDVVGRSNADDTILVLGHRADEIIKKIETKGLRVVLNKNPAAGMSSSLKAGLAAVGPDFDAVLIVLADQPFLKTAMLNRIIAAHRRSGRRIVVPVHHGVQGNPVLFHKSLFDELAAITGDTGAKRVIGHHPDEVLRLEVADALSLVDIDTRKDLRMLDRGRTSRTIRRNRATGAPRRAHPR